MMEAGSHAFVVRIWVEEGTRPTWRGHVTHVQSGERRSFGDLQEMVAFITPYLEALRAPPGGREE